MGALFQSVVVVVSFYVNLRSNVLCPLVFMSHEYLPKVFYLIQCLAINPYGVRTFQDNVRVIYDHEIVYELCNVGVTVLYMIFHYKINFTIIKKRKIR